MSRLRILLPLAALTALALTLVACGSSGSDDPQTIVKEATLQGIESGKLDLAVEVDVKGSEGGHLAVDVSGPFQGEEEAEWPELDISFVAKGELGAKKIDREGAFTLLGDKAYVGYEGTEYEVDSTTFDFVKSMIKQQSGGKGQANEVTACQEAASGLKLADFVENLKDEGSADVGGTSTTKVSGDLDAASAVEAFSELTEDPACSAQLQAAGPLPSQAELEAAKGKVKDSVKSAHVDLYVGDDHIVRRIAAQATIEPPKGSEGGAKRVDLEIDLKLTGVNEDQAISAPQESKPLSKLFLKLGINPLELLGAFQNGGSGGIGGLLEQFGEATGGSSGGNSSQGGGQQSYYECLGEAHTPVDIQHCTGLLQ